VGSDWPAALSTGQAAKFCLVTADTIVNWIKHNRLTARRTAGGQYRILVRDLRQFMNEQGMETDLLDGAFEQRRYCWEYCDDRGLEPILGASCTDCLVRRSRSLDCFELRSALSSQGDELDVCARCRYLNEARLEAEVSVERYH